MNDAMVIIKGDRAIDDRGKLTFVNDFDFSGVKRFYQVENYERGFIRAWHGHEVEQKWVYVVKGSIILCIADMITLTVDTRWLLSADKPCIAHIPSGKYNGFRTLTDDTVVIFFSSLTMDEAKSDDTRKPWDYFDKTIWDVEYR